MICMSMRIQKQNKNRMLGSDTTQILPFKAQPISFLLSEQEVQAFFLKMSVDLGECWQRANTWTPCGSAFVPWKTDCYSSYIIGLYRKAAVPLHFLVVYYRSLQMYLLLQISQKFPLFGGGLGVVVVDYFSLLYLRI